MHQIDTNRKTIAASRSALLKLGVACLLALTAAAPVNANAAAPEQGYVDSVYSWGVWELGLEPTSGPQPQDNDAMKDRSRSLLFRPNDNAAYVTQSVPVPLAATPAPPSPSLPASPPLPVCLLYTSPSPRDGLLSRMPSSA